MSEGRQRPKVRREAKTAQEILLGSRLLHCAPEKGRMPAADEELSKRFSWQPSVYADQKRPGNPLVRIELHAPFELIGSDKLPEAVGDEIRGFLNGEVDWKDEKSTFVDPSSGENHKPEIYHIAPLFSPEDISSSSKMIHRVRLVESRMSTRPRSISIRFKEFVRALEGNGLRRLRKGGADYAHWAEPLHPKDQRGSSALLLAMLPNREKLEKRNGVFYVPNRRHHDRAGVLVWVDSQVVENLLVVVPLITDDLDDLARSYYTKEG